MRYKWRKQLDIISWDSLGSCLHVRGVKKTIWGTCVNKSKVEIEKNLKKGRFFVTYGYSKYWKLGHFCKISMQCLVAGSKLNFMTSSNIWAPNKSNIVDIKKWCKNSSRITSRIYRRHTNLTVEKESKWGFYMFLHIILYNMNCFDIKTCFLSY